MLKNGFIAVALLSAIIAAQQANTDIEEEPTLELAEVTAEETGESEDDAEASPEETITEDAEDAIAVMPSLTRFVEADYPQEVYGKGIEGTVLMDLVVNDGGHVDSAAVVKGLHPLLDSNAVAAARQFVFSPARLGSGEAVPVLLQYEYRFSLDEIVEKIERYPNFTGRLIEQGTRKPIADAMVVIAFIDTLSDTTLDVPFDAYRERIGSFDGQYLEEDRLVTLTDSLGRFTFYSLPACEIEVSAPLSGYEQFRETETINPGEQLQAKYYLRRLSYSDYEIVVYGKGEEKEVSRRSLSLQEVKKVPGLGGDAVKVVQAMPGVARSSFGLGNIVVRGAPSWDTEYLLDGVEISQVFHYGIKSTYNSEALESVDFYPGGFGVRYGSSIAGVVEITGRRPKTDRWHGYADLSSMDGSFFVEGPINEKASVLASARRSFIGEIIRFGIDRIDYNFGVTAYPFYWDYLVRADYDFTPQSHAYLTLFGYRDSMSMVAPTFRGGSEEVDDAVNEMGMSLTENRAIVGWDWDIN
ncbi:MAG: TonB family protein, partial [Chitinivibrionales bacterium]|nr:TonB family protein [Chitinivibrionales bacterium]MBD3358616.1 TonB family protein [Chitinivibrionales bacterium]